MASSRHSRITHVAIAAHPDDLEIMAAHGILECYGRKDRRFLGIVCTDGAGGPRNERFAHLSKQAYVEVRRREQEKAAKLGKYDVIQLGYPSAVLKGKQRSQIILKIQEILSRTKPRVIYTHNPADKHDTHVATAMLTIRALRDLAPRGWPQDFYGCEVWRDLDWLSDEKKVVLNVSTKPKLTKALLRAFKSQTAGGKRFDLGTIGRRHAQATFYESHRTDRASQVTFAVDLLPLIQKPSLDPAAYLSQLIDELQRDVTGRIRKWK